MEKKVYIGMDIHKKSWRVNIDTDICHHKNFNIESNEEILYNYIEKHFMDHEVHLVYEIGCCGFSCARYFLSIGWKVMVVNPADIPRTDKQNYQKTDTIDARQLCKLYKAGQLRGIYVPTETEDNLKLLLRQRNNIVRELRRQKNQIKSQLLYIGKSIPEEFDNPHWSKAFIDWIAQIDWKSNMAKISMDSKLNVLKLLNQEFLYTTNELAKYYRTNHKEDYYLLKSIPGFGRLVVSAILTELGDIRRFSNERELSSYIGVVPGILASGGSERCTGITPRCRSLLRSYIIEASWVAIRTDPEIQSYYRKHVGKNVKSIIVKIAHKLIRRMWSVLRNKTPYQINYQTSLQNS
jgi:transposase